MMLRLLFRWNALWRWWNRWLAFLDPGPSDWDDR